MPRDGAATKQKILDAAQDTVLKQGFAGTSVDDIQERAGISRGSFFYHFPSKADLARTLIRRYADADRRTADEFMARAERLAPDPARQLLIFIGLYIEMLDEVEDEAPGCLFASYSYEAGLFDEETMGVISEAMHHWRELVGAKLDQAIRRHPPPLEVDPDTLADLAYGIFEGALVVSRIERRPRIIADHMRHYRSYLELLFGVADEDSP